MYFRFLIFIFLFFVLFVLFGVTPSIAQSRVTFDAGQVFSTYKFIDAQGTTEKNFTNKIAGCFSLGYQYAKNNGLFIRANIGMRKAGASIIVNETTINWNVQYADAAVGVGYMLNKWRLKPYFSIAPYFGYMLNANQTVGPDTYDIMKNKSMQTTDYGLFLSPGLKVDLSNFIALYAEYKHILGLQNLEKPVSNGIEPSEQKSFNRGFSINLGVAVTIIKYKYVTSH